MHLQVFLLFFYTLHRKFLVPVKVNSGILNVKLTVANNSSKECIKVQPFMYFILCTLGIYIQYLSIGSVVVVISPETTRSHGLQLMPLPVNKGTQRLFSFDRACCNRSVCYLNRDLTGRIRHLHKLTD